MPKRSRSSKSPESTSSSPWRWPFGSRSDPVLVGPEDSDSSHQQQVPAPLEDPVQAKDEDTPEQQITLPSDDKESVKTTPSTTIVSEQIEDLTFATSQTTWSWLGYSYPTRDHSTSPSVTEVDVQTDIHIPASLLKKGNVVLPSVDSQFPLPPDSSSLTLFHRTLNVIHSLWSGSSSFGKCEFERIKANPELLSLKRFVVVGVHGWFPTKLVRSVIGEPTGTSTKLCERMLEATKQYIKNEFGYDVPSEHVTVIPLQWEGKVEERVQEMFNQLLQSPSWMDALRTADVVLWTTHSQGTPVSAMLLRKLIEEHYVRLSHQSILLLAMAGICHGPFPSLKGGLYLKYVEADAARELFEFTDSNSAISQVFTRSLAYLLRSGVKTVMVGSLQDQVVPLYSAIMTNISHPHLFRAIYIDGHLYDSNDFVINLVLFALTLRNYGLSDHGLINYLSDVLAGSLFTLEGAHSTIYEELDVYALGLHYLFEVKPQGLRTIPSPLSAAVASKEAQIDSFRARMRINPYFLPWAMRGVYEDPRIQQHPILRLELDRLRQLFDQWNPTNAKLRDVKFRLEPLKARL